MDMPETDIHTERLECVMNERSIPDIRLGTACDGNRLRPKSPQSFELSQIDWGTGSFTSMLDMEFTEEKCTAQAVYVVSGHMLDYCKKTKAVNAMGNWNALLCPQCTAALVQTYVQLFESPAVVRCDSCLRSFKALHEVIHVDHLETGTAIPIDGPFR